MIYLKELLDKKMHAYLAEKDHTRKYFYYTQKEWEYQKTLIKEGRCSLLKSMYDINVEEHESCLCFRSEGEDANIDCNDISRIFFHYDINSFIDKMMVGIKNAVNDNKNLSKTCNSFSKGLAVPLFKYVNSDRLIISQMELNTVSLICQFEDSKHREIYERVEFNVPLKKLYSSDFLEKCIYQEMEKSHKCIDEKADLHNVFLCPKGFCVDISKIDRKDFSNYYTYHNLTELKSRVSYKTDREVISSECGEVLHDTKNKKLIQILRFLYILGISGLSEPFNKITDEIVNDKCQEIILLNEQEKKMMKWFLSYMADETLEYEKLFYIDSLSYKDNGSKQDSNRPKFLVIFKDKDHVKDGVKELLESQSFKEHCIDDGLLLLKLKEKANL